MICFLRFAFITSALLILAAGCADSYWTGDYLESHDGVLDFDTETAMLSFDTASDSNDALLDSETGDVSDTDTVLLLGPPLAFAPTAAGIGINAVVASGKRERLRLSIRSIDDTAWSDMGSPTLVGKDVVEWQLTDLKGGPQYDYSIFYTGANGSINERYRGSFTTQRPIGQAFSFAMLTDSHIQTEDAITEWMDDAAGTLDTVANTLYDNETPEFVINLGDLIDFHQYGFVVPPPDGTSTRTGYLNYRMLMGNVLGNAAHYMVVGNWDGENGHFEEAEIAYSREQRLMYIPGPEPTTYAQGGSAEEDYYAFTWGNALFIVLNIMTYTPTAHRLSNEPGLPDDWTLGEEQILWLEETLSAATSTWRFIFIHHPAGGAAGDSYNSAYGRGGGQAADVGEQAIIHQMMIDHGVQIFFYGHDHVFTDMLIDNIHYTLPGSAGAPWKFDSSETGYSTYWSDSGYAICEVSPDIVEVKFMGQSGTLLDSYTLENK